MNHDLKTPGKKLASTVGSFNSRENIDNLNKPTRKRTNMGIFTFLGL